MISDAELRARLAAPYPEPLFSYPVGDYRILEVRPENAALYLNRVAQRALRFIDQFAPECDESWLTDLIFKVFRQSPKQVFILVALDGSDEMIGHVIAYVEYKGNLGYVGHILQLSVDPERVPWELTTIGLKLIEAWARDLKLTCLMDSCVSISRARMTRIKHGFEVYRVETRKVLNYG